MGESKEILIKLMKADDEKTIAKAARLCYFPSTIEELEEQMDDKRCATLIRKLKELDHGSPFEHVSYTFGIEGISRACTHQLVRHRIASYNQQSQRYVKETQFEYIIPPSVIENGMEESYRMFMEKQQDMYNVLREAGCKAEDARFVLPNAAETKIIMTINARSLMNFFKVRRKADAQWEIRELADKIYEIVKDIHPNIWSEE